MGYTEKWFSILNSIREFSENDVHIWYRGHSSVKYNLHSGLFRVESQKLREFLIDERNRYYEFLNLGHLDHGEADWNLLFLMQHHGVKTRLLDWSEAFTTALFFAYIDWDPSRENACVWMLKPTKLNNLYAESNREELLVPAPGSYVRTLEQANKKNEGFGEKSFALYPVKNSKRLIAQQGVFTVQGNSLLPLEEENDCLLLKAGYLKMIELTPDLYEDVRLFLKLSGTNQFTLFPDLDGLSRYINTPMRFRPQGIYTSQT